MAFRWTGCTQVLMQPAEPERDRVCPRETRAGARLQPVRSNGPGASSFYRNALVTAPRRDLLPPEAATCGTETLVSDGLLCDGTQRTRSVPFRET